MKLSELANETLIQVRTYDSSEDYIDDYGGYDEYDTMTKNAYLNLCRNTTYEKGESIHDAIIYLSEKSAIEFTFEEIKYVVASYYDLSFSRDCTREEDDLLNAISVINKYLNEDRDYEKGEEIINDYIFVKSIDECGNDANLPF